MTLDEIRQGIENNTYHLSLYKHWMHVYENAAVWYGSTLSKKPNATIYLGNASENTQLLMISLHKYAIGGIKPEYLTDKAKRLHDMLWRI